MAVQFSCPECGKVLKSSNPIAPGKKVKCPSCAAIFAPAVKPAAPVKKTPPPDDETMELPKTKPVPAGLKKPSKPAPMEDENPDEEDMPTKKAPPRKPVMDDEDDDDDRPRPKAGIQAKKPLPPPSNDFGFDDEEEETAPSKPKGKKAPPPMDDEEDDELPPPTKVKKGAPPPMKKGRPDDDDDEDDDRPIKKGKGKKKSNAGLFILIGVVVLLLGLGAVAAFIWPGFLKGPDNAPIGKGKGGGGGDKKPEPFTGQALAYVPPDAFALIGISPPAVKAGKISGSLYSLFTAKVAAEAKKGGIKAEEVNALLGAVDKVYVALLPGAGKPGQLAIFSAKADVEKVKSAFGAKDVPGETFWQMKDGAYLVHPHEGIFIISDLDQAALHMRLETIGRNVELSEDVKTQMGLVQDAPIWAVVGSIPDLKAATGDLGGQLGKKDKGPDPMGEALERAKAATFDVREVGANVVLKARVVCQDAADAQNIDKGLQGLVAILPFMLAGLEGKKDTPPEVAALLKNAVGTLKVGSKGNEVWMTAQVSQADIATLMKLLAAAPGPVPAASDARAALSRTLTPYLLELRAPASSSGGV